MPAYVVFTREETLDQQELDAYSSHVGPTFGGHDVTVLAAYGPFEQLEGPPIEGAVILRFPNRQAARDWYDSPDYQAVAAHRFAGARYHGFVVDGAE